MIPAWNDEEAAYDRIRGDDHDVSRISSATGFKGANITTIKQHLFFLPHLLDKFVHLGHPAEYRCFDASPDIAAAWSRLQTAPPSGADAQLLRHEMAEAWYMRQHGPSYEAAHKAAQRRFPSPLEVRR